jgi:hypothetical protein
MMQVSHACKQLQHTDLKLVAGIVQRIKQLLQRQGAGHRLHGATPAGLTATIGNAVAALDMQQLAGGVRALVASSRLEPSSKLTQANAGMLWDVHAWLVQHQLLDGQGLAGLLSQQQLEQGRAAAEAYHEQQEQ